MFALGEKTGLQTSNTQTKNMPALRHALVLTSSPLVFCLLFRLALCHPDGSRS